MAGTGPRRVPGSAGGARGGRGGQPGRPGRPAGPSTVQAAEAVTTVVTAPLTAAGFDLEDVRVTRAGARYVVAVAVDRDGGLDLDAIAAASRLVSDVLDAVDADLPAALRGAYTLEVSSRGATAPLSLPRHWRRARGRLVEVRRRAGLGEVVGRVTGADEQGATLDVDGEALEVPYELVARAVVQLEFRRPAGAAPAGDAGSDPGGLDELDDLDDPDDLDDVDDPDDPVELDELDDTDDDDEEETP